MKMIVEVLTRGDGYLAVAGEEGTLLSESGVGGGDHEREAIVQAVNSYYKRREQPSDGRVVQPHPACSARVAVGPNGIKSLLQEVIKASGSGSVAISGKKVNGDRYAGRVVAPLALRPSYFPEFLYCLDEPSGENRTFRLDGIERVEAI